LVEENMDCGGKRSATPLSDRTCLARQPRESAVAAALCQHSPKRGPADMSALDRETRF